MCERENRRSVVKKAGTLLAMVMAAGLIGGSVGGDYNVSYAAEIDTGMYEHAQDVLLTTSVEGPEVTSGGAVTGSGVTGTSVTGWVQEDEKWHYYKEGTLQEKKAGWYKIKNKYYYLKADGSRVEKEKGFYYIGNKWCYLSNSGEKLSKSTGWYKVSKKWYYIKSNGSYYSGWKKISGKKYYFGSKGVCTNGWVKVGKTKYYQTKEKGLYKNAVLKDSSNGKYYYVNENGKRIDNKITKQLVKVYRACTKDSMSKEQKLYAMYMYLATPKTKNKHFRYKRRYDDYKYIGKSGWTADYAYQLLSTGKGNCYRFACSFGYFAKMLGYDSYVQVGKCTGIRGGFTPHSWVEIRMNGKTYVYDPELQFAGAASDLYKKTYSTNPVTLKKGKAYKIKF